MINSINQSLIALALSIVYLLSSSTTSYLVDTLPMRWIVLIAVFVFVEFMLVSMVIDDILRKLSSKDYPMTRVPGSSYYLQREIIDCLVKIYTIYAITRYGLFNAMLSNQDQVRLLLIMIVLLLVMLVMFNAINISFSVIKGGRK